MCLPSANITFVLMAVALPARAAMPASQAVEIPSGTAMLHAQLFKPEGSGPFPVVIALHGGGGLGGHSEPVQVRYRDWAEELLKDGKAVLFPDSYGSPQLWPPSPLRGPPGPAPPP